MYSVSCLLDAFDGAAARRYNQSTKFGAVLDMVTDRCTTGCLLCFLSSAYPQYTFIFQLLISVDLASHYIHMYSTLNQGVTSHKKIPADQHWLLRLYYGNNVFGASRATLTCPDTPRLFSSSSVRSTRCSSLHSIFYISRPRLTLHHSSVKSPYSAYMCPIDRVGRPFNIDLSWPMAIALISAIPCFVKQVISVVQLVNASNALVELDKEERAEAFRSAAK